MLRGIVVLALATACGALRAPPRAGNRRAVLQGAASFVLSAASPAAFAFDTPDLTAFDDPKAKALFADKANPGLAKQASASFYAITTGDLISLKKMLDAGWNLGEACDTAGKTPMHRAAQVGNTGAIQLLVDAGVSPSVTNKFDESPLHFAVRNNRLPAVKMLVGAGADRAQKTFGGDTALVLAQKYKMTAVEDYLTSL